MDYKLEELSTEIQRFLIDINSELLSVATCRKNNRDFQSIFQKHAGIFDIFLIAEFDEKFLREDGVARKRYQLIRRFLHEGYALAPAISFLDTLHNRYNRPPDESDAGMSLSKMDSVIRRIEDREKRKELEEIRSRRLDRINKGTESVIKRLYQASRDLGYRNFTELSLDLRGMEIGWVTEMINIIIDRTRSLYEELLATFLNDIEIDTKVADKYDILHVLQGGAFDSVFPDGRAGETVKDSLRNMGFQIDGMENIRFEVGKETVLTIPMYIPERIFYLVNDDGGYRSYLAHYGEAGRALHMGHISPGLHIEFRYLVDESIIEAFRLLFQRIISTRSWLSNRTGEEEMKIFRKLFLLDRIYHLRHTCSLLQYEMRVHMSAVGGADELFKSIMEENLNISYPAEDFLIETSVPFRSADRFRAYLFEAMLRKALIEKYGDGWHMNPGTTSFLKEIWSWGGKFGLKELAHYIGYAEVDPEPLVEEMEDRVKLT